MQELAENLIQRFVAALNTKGTGPLFDRDVPQELRTNEDPDITDMFHWKIRPVESNPWIPALKRAYYLNRFQSSMTS